MKIKSLFCIVFLSFFASVFAEDAVFNIATYNIRQYNEGDVAAGNGWQRRLPVVAALIRFHDFEIFGTQEGFKHQLDDLKNLLPGFEYTGVAREDGKEEGEHSAIFYDKEKFELLDHGDFWLSENPDKPGLGWDAACVRICSWGKFLHKPSGKTFKFYNLHLDHVGTKARAESCRLVKNKIEGDENQIPVFLSGDFNVDQHNEIYSILTSLDALKDSYTKADLVYALNGTYNAYKTDGYTDSRIDHIFVSDNVKVEKYGVLTDTYRTPIIEDEALPSPYAPAEITILKYEARTPSDHFPVMLKVRF